VHALRENVRQADPEERTILAHLRAGNVEQAVNWYAGNGRIDTAADREQALEQTVAAWVEDPSEGRESIMMAWRRANVAALNTRARQAMRQAGRLTGPELQVGANTYQAGDRIVTLAPSAHGQMVTSQRGQVVGVDPDASGLTVRTDDGRTHTLGTDLIGPDKLALGYATTVHRSQGATFDTAHLVADGGGRGLGYVAMSRARHSAHVHAVADNVYQAVEGLTWEWGREKRQAWAIDTGQPETHGRHPLEIEADKQGPAKLGAVLSRARFKAERAALVAAASDQPDPAVRRQVAGLDRHIQLLDQRLDPSKHPLAIQPFSTPGRGTRARTEQRADPASAAKRMALRCSKTSQTVTIEVQSDAPGGRVWQESGHHRWEGDGPRGRHLPTSSRRKAPPTRPDRRHTDRPRDGAQMAYVSGI
jgi:hypothetical protein